MDWLVQKVNGHDKRISDLEMHNLQTTHSLEMLSQQVKGMDANFMKLEKTMLEEGEKNRVAQDRLIDRFDKNNERQWAYLDKQKSYEETAAVREHETKRTKFQIIRDIFVAGGIGYLIIQESIRLFF